MRSTLTPPPERGMPPGRHDRRRMELLELTTTSRSRTRTAVPLLAAASVVAVTATVVAVPALRPEPAPSSPGGPVATTTTVAAVSTIKPAPVAHDLTSAESAAFRQACKRSDFGMPSRYDGEIVGGIRFTRERRDLPAAWLVVRRGAQYTICIANGRGQVIGDAGFGPDSVKDTEYLYAPVDVRGRGTGPYTGRVAKVTVQSRDEPERYAVLRYGFWFASYDDQRYYTWNGANPPREDSGLIGVPYGYTFRGYDSAGRLVYDSSKNGPSVKDCYTDPAGHTVIVDNGVPDPSPSKCRRTLLWNR